MPNMSRSQQYLRIGWSIAASIACTAAVADDLSDAEELICYGWSAARCHVDGGCDETAPWLLNLPDFLKVDLDRGVAENTGAPEQRRVTEIDSITRRDGLIVMQGHQENRAFSWLITEATGEGTLTVSTPDSGLTVFTICTPIEDL